MHTIAVIQSKEDVEKLLVLFEKEKERYAYKELETLLEEFHPDMELEYDFSENFTLNKKFFSIKRHVVSPLVYTRPRITVDEFIAEYKKEEETLSDYVHSQIKFYFELDKKILHYNRDCTRKTDELYAFLRYVEDEIRKLGYIFINGRFIKQDDIENLPNTIYRP